MHFRYFIRVLEIPNQAEHLYGTEVDGALDASERVATLLQRHHIGRCFVTEFGATVDGGGGSQRQYGFREQQVEHVRAIASVYAGWFVVSRPARFIMTSSDLGHFGPNTVLLRQEPDMQSVINYELAEKKHLLKVRFGRPTSPPRRPALFDLLHSSRPSFNLDLAMELLAEYGGVAFFRETGNCTIIVTWTQEPASVWLARWQAAVAHPDEVGIVDDVPID